MNIKVKICGIRNLESAEVAVSTGADFMGFVFVPGSRRFIKTDVAKHIIEQLRRKIKTVGVFKNQPIEKVNQISSLLNLDYVQLHGEETSDYCNQVSTKVIKAFPLKSNFDTHKILENMKEYAVDYFLVDREKQSEGEMLNLQKVREIANKFSVIFAGGLNPDNVKDIIEIVKPAGVDVVSGIETDGFEDKEKIKKFIKNAKGVSI